jgi:S-adenosylmethionine hydrolase
MGSVTKPNGIVTLLTDFGADDAYVGAMKGAILTTHSRANVVDITHGVRPFAVLQGAFLLDSAWRSFPVGTVHVAVVDPGVGTSRKAIAFKAADHYFVGPDNGLFTFLTEPISETAELAVPPEAAPTFHGRDLFGPVAARLAAGATIAEVGRLRREEPMRLQEAWASKVGEAWRATVLHCDHFGNVISNLPIRALARIKVVNGTRVRTVETYDEAEPNELVALVGSSGRIEFALREGSAASRLHSAPGDTLLVT